jgi:hypothetical protein
MGKGLYSPACNIIVQRIGRGTAYEGSTPLPSVILELENGQSGGCKEARSD